MVLIICDDVDIIKGIGIKLLRNMLILCDELLKVMIVYFDNYVVYVFLCVVGMSCV